MIRKPFLSIDWDVRTLRIVHALGGRSVTIDRVLSVPIPRGVRTDDAESMGGFIRGALEKAGLSTKRAVVDVPREQANLCTLKLPRASESDLASMVAYQMPRELPYPVDQAAVDFTMLPPERQPETHEVLVAAVRKDRLAFYEKVFAAAGLKLQRVGLRPNANEFAVNALLRATPQETVLFVDVGPQTTEINVLRGGRLVFSRAASVAVPADLDAGEVSASMDDAAAGAGEGSPGEESGAGGRDAVLSFSVTPGDRAARLKAAVDELMIEVTRSIEAYRVNDPGLRLDHAVIGGSCDLEEALCEAVEAKYRISAQPYNPAGCFGWDADRGAAAGAFSATIGLALSHTAPSFGRYDFLHPKRAVTRAERRIKKAPVAAAAVLLFAVAGVVFYMSFIKPQYAMRDRLLARIDEQEKRIEKQRQFAKTVKALEEYESQQIVWIDALYDVVRRLPDEKQIVLKSVDLSQKEHRIRFPYRANDSVVAPELIASLESYVPKGSRRSVFKGTLGATSKKTGDLYPFHGAIDVSIVDRDWIED